VHRYRAFAIIEKYRYQQISFFCGIHDRASSPPSGVFYGVKLAVVDPESLPELLKFLQ
jgi:hypothetical protein